jgi:hypothetical protein
MPAYSGLVRILDPTGSLLTVGQATIDRTDVGWEGTIEVIGGTGVAGKALVVDLEFDGRRSRAQLIPVDDNGDVAHSRIVGLGPAPPA